ncbi:hypothetical protein HanPSC8_Chr10g0418911 [Helianthus annuus]|nr:hypothetical protein HanPSC8_Chr10g0418911 [Helianthus annuus]
MWCGYSRLLVLNFRLMVFYLELFNVISCFMAALKFIFHFDRFYMFLKNLN